MMKDNAFEDNKLPSEPLLAQKLGISLVTLREALLMLALEGYITKRHGSGNYIHKSALDFENRSIYFADCLEKEGYKATSEVLERKFISAESKLKKLLKFIEMKILYIISLKEFAQIVEKLLTTMQNIVLNVE